jgi:hypothetical protein
MPSLLEDRIWQLCSQVVIAANNDAEIERLIPELRTAIAEYIQNMRSMSAKVIPCTCGTDRKAA